VVFDVRGDVLVVRVSGSQFGNMGMFERIIPGNLFAGPIDFITVVQDSPGIKVKEFPHIQHDVAHQSDLSFSEGVLRTTLARVGPIVAKTKVECWMLGERSCSE